MQLVLVTRSLTSTAVVEARPWTAAVMSLTSLAARPACCEVHATAGVAAVAVAVACVAVTATGTSTPRVAVTQRTPRLRRGTECLFTTLMTPQHQKGCTTKAVVCCDVYHSR